MSICLAADPNWYLYRWGLGKLVAKWKEIDLIRAAASSRNTALLASCLWNPSHRIDSLSLFFFVFFGGRGWRGVFSNIDSSPNKYPVLVFNKPKNKFGKLLHICDVELLVIAPHDKFTMYAVLSWFTLLWRKINFVVIYALLCGTKINQKILSVEEKLKISCLPKKSSTS